jgi:hypothetical protein
MRAPLYPDWFVKLKEKILIHVTVDFNIQSGTITVNLHNIVNGKAITLQAFTGP